MATTQERLAKIELQLGRIERWLIILTKQEVNVAGELDALRAEVARNTTVDESAIALLRGLKAKLDAAIAVGDPAAIQALATELAAKTDLLAAAVVENTPSEPTP